MPFVDGFRRVDCGHLPARFLLLLLFPKYFNINHVAGPYLFKLCGDNKHAGYAEGVQGTFQALASIPAGILADRYRRDTVLKYSGVIGIIGTILTIVGLCQPADTTWKVRFWPRTSFAPFYCGHAVNYTMPLWIKLPM